MKVLILGGTGQVGGALQLTAPDWAEVTALERSDCDIGDVRGVEAAINDHAPVLVINAAAYTAVDVRRTLSDDQVRHIHEGPRRKQPL